MLLDADTAGAVMKVLGTWDEGGHAARDELARYAATLDVVLPSMTGEMQGTFSSFGRLSRCCSACDSDQRAPCPGTANGWAHGASSA